MRIAKFIAKRGEGIHHIAFEVENMESEMNRLLSEGFELIHTEVENELKDADAFKSIVIDEAPRKWIFARKPTRLLGCPIRRRDRSW